MTAAAPHPFLTAIEELPSRFPELNANDQLAQIATMIVIPNLKIAAKKDPDAIRAATVRFLSRFVIGLGVAPQEIYSPAEIGAARAALEATPGPEPAAAPAVRDANLDRVLAGDDN